MDEEKVKRRNACLRQIEQLDDAIAKLIILRDSFSDDRTDFNNKYIVGKWKWKGSLASSFVIQGINPNVEDPYSTGAKRINYFVGELKKKRKSLVGQLDWGGTLRV